MENSKNYIIRGGIKGRERLRIIFRILQATTISLFDRLKICSGAICLDAGCGGEILHGQDGGRPCPRCRSTDSWGPAVRTPAGATARM